jgi:hypothetical protein
MTLKEIRALFTTRSGRFDLITEEGLDNGADFFIQAGCRTLDRMIQHVKSVATHYEAIEAGDYYLIFTRCRAIKQVWVSNALSRTELELYTPKDFYLDYAGPASTISQGRPSAYTPINLRTVEKEAFNSLATFMQYVRADDETYNGIVFPPADGNYVVEIIGLFESKALECEIDENYWSVNFPDLLILAAMYKLEVFNRNKQGAEDWLAGITMEITQLEKDMVEQDDQLEDSR